MYVGAGAGVLHHAGLSQWHACHLEAPGSGARWGLRTSQPALHPVQAADTPCKTEADSWQLELKACEVTVEESTQCSQAYLATSKGCFTVDTTQADSVLLLFYSKRFNSMFKTVILLDSAASSLSLCGFTLTCWHNLKTVLSEWMKFKMSFPVHS